MWLYNPVSCPPVLSMAMGSYICSVIAKMILELSIRNDWQSIRNDWYTVDQYLFTLASTFYVHLFAFALPGSLLDSLSSSFLVPLFFLSSSSYAYHLHEPAVPVLPQCQHFRTLTIIVLCQFAFSAESAKFPVGGSKISIRKVWKVEAKKFAGRAFREMFVCIWSSWLRFWTIIATVHAWKSTISPSSFDSYLFKCGLGRLEWC